VIDVSLTQTSKKWRATILVEGIVRERRCHRPSPDKKLSCRWQTAGDCDSKRVSKIHNYL